MSEWLFEVQKLAKISTTLMSWKLDSPVSIISRESCFFFNFQGRQKSASCIVFFGRPDLERYEAEGKQFKICFCYFCFKDFFLECFFFCSLLVEQEISLEKKNKKNNTNRSDCPNPPQEIPTPVRRTLRVANDVKPDAKIGSIFWVPRWWRHCAKSGFFSHMKNQNIKTLTFHCYVLVGSGSRIPISLSWFIMCIYIYIWSLYNWVVVSSLKVVCELPSANEPSVRPNSSFSINSRRRKMPTKPCRKVLPAYTRQKLRWLTGPKSPNFQ